MLGKFAALDAQNPANERLEQCFVDIATEINRLYKISSTAATSAEKTKFSNQAIFISQTTLEVMWSLLYAAISKITLALDFLMSAR